jgi:peptidoglycan/LPS O-acetylase OafA/YrhL
MNMPDNPSRARPGPLGYVPELDGVRGLAILFVLGNHIPLRQIQSLLPGGFIGVDIFFVLSGFLITTLLVQEFDRTGAINLRYFYTRRALRLGPALLVFLAVLCSLSFVLYDPARARGNCRDALIALFYLSNWVRVLSSNQLGLLAHTWSLSTEEQFYILWPLILLTLLRRSKSRYRILVAAGAITLLSWLVNFYLAMHLASQRRLFLQLCFRFDSRVGTLMIGCMLGVVYSSGLLTDKATRLLRKTLVFLAPVALAGLVVFSIYSYVIGGIFFYFGFGLVALLAAALLLDVLLNPRGVFRRLMSMKWLVWVGSVSYGLYLWHWPIFYGMDRFGFKGWTVVLAGLPVTLVVVSLSYYLLERPMLRLKQRFTDNNKERTEENEALEARPDRILSVDKAAGKNTLCA